MTGSSPDARLPRWPLTVRQSCDLELIATGGFAPLRSFLGAADVASVCDRMRLTDGSLWPMPVVLDVPESVARAAERAGTLILEDDSGQTVASLDVAELWMPDRWAEAEAVFRTTDLAHPGVSYLINHTNAWYLTGELTVLRLPEHPELPIPVATPAEVRAEIARRGWERVVAFNTRNPMHEAHRELAIRAAQAEDAGLLVHPVVGMSKPGDVPAPVRVRSYLAIMERLPKSRSMLALLPLAMRMGGPREALWHATIRRNYGVTAFIVGRDHAGPGASSSGEPFYGLYEAQDLVARYVDEIGIRMVRGREIVYVSGLGHMPADEVPSGLTATAISGTRLRRSLADGTPVPGWLASPEVVAALREGTGPDTIAVAG